MMTTDSVPTPGAPNVLPQDPTPEPGRPPVPTDPPPLDNPPPAETPTPAPRAHDDHIIDLRSPAEPDGPGQRRGGPAEV